MVVVFFACVDGEGESREEVACWSTVGWNGQKYYKNGQYYAQSAPTLRSAASVRCLQKTRKKAEIASVLFLSFPARFLDGRDGRQIKPRRKAINPYIPDCAACFSLFGSCQSFPAAVDDEQHHELSIDEQPLSLQSFLVWQLPGARPVAKHIREYSSTTAESANPQPSDIVKLDIVRHVGGANALVLEEFLLRNILTEGRRQESLQAPTPRCMSTWTRQPARYMDGEANVYTSRRYALHALQLSNCPTWVCLQRRWTVSAHTPRSRADRLQEGSKGGRPLPGISPFPYHLVWLPYA